MVPYPFYCDYLVHRPRCNPVPKCLELLPTLGADCLGNLVQGLDGFKINILASRVPL